MGEARVLEQFAAEAIAVLASRDIVTSHVVKKVECLSI